MSLFASRRHYGYIRLTAPHQLHYPPPLRKVPLIDPAARSVARLISPARIIDSQSMQQHSQIETRKQRRKQSVAHASARFQEPGYQKYQCCEGGRLNGCCRDIPPWLSGSSRSPKRKGCRTDIKRPEAEQMTYLTPATSCNWR
jgi:hypothetical protein